DYTGTVIGTKIVDATCTGGTPPLPVPANTQLPAGDCLTHCRPPGEKFGSKFNDLNKNGVKDAGEPGLPGWEIRIFDTATHALIDKTTTLVDGSYMFDNLAPGSYTACEVLQAGWTQSAPCAAGGPPGTCVGTPIPSGEALADCTPFGA